MKELRAGEPGKGAAVALERIAEALGRDVVREQRGVEGAGGEVLEQRVEGEEGAHLVQTPDDTPAGEHERSPRGTLCLCAHGSWGVSAEARKSLRIGIARGSAGTTIMEPCAASASH